MSWLGSVDFNGPGGERYVLAVAGVVRAAGLAIVGREAAAIVDACLGTAVRDGADDALRALLGRAGLRSDGPAPALVAAVSSELAAGAAGRVMLLRDLALLPTATAVHGPDDVDWIDDVVPLVPETPKDTPKTWFEVVVVDEIGEPIPGVTLSILVDGKVRREDTDGAGKIRVQDVEPRFALVDVDAPEQLLEECKSRWEQVRDGDWLEEDEPDHTFFSLRSVPEGIRISAETPHTLVVQPRVVLGRLRGMLFDTNKTFLLPSALPELQRLKRLYDEHEGSTLLVVGHTDTSGDAGTNDPLSLARAQAVEAFVRDNPEPWLAWYESGKPYWQRWGAREDGQMLQAVLARDVEAQTGSPLRHFQRTRGLADDGVAGPNTRAALIAEYMELDETSLPADVELVVHGCGENFPLDDTGEALDPDAADGEVDALDRRVELFFFEGELGVLPPVAGDNSAAGSGEYPEWRKRARETHEFVAGGEIIKLVLDDPLFGLLTHVPVEVTYEDAEPETVNTDGSGAFAIKASRGRFADLSYQWQGRVVERRVFTALDDAASREGAWQRLVHLGYTPVAQPDQEPPDDDALGDAVVMFQLDHYLDATGELDDGTVDELLRAHDEDIRAWADRDWELPEVPAPDSEQPKAMVA
ncbi:MAG: OmpA family protein [Myxococcota bacterium]